MRQRVRDTLDSLRLGVLAHDAIAWGRHLTRPALHLQNFRFSRLGAPDGLPLPSQRLIYGVTGGFDLVRFFDQGLLGARCIRETLQRNQIALTDCEAILDFGCGCGRILRHWRTLQGPAVHGSDLNPRAVAWCQHNLPFARCSTNGLAPPLKFADGQFDLVYAISVFTHLTEALQDAWLAELHRVIRPGGHLLITVHGISRRSQLTAEERVRFDAGEYVVVRARYPGDNVCTTYHPEAYVRERLGHGFELLDLVPEGARDARQDQVLLLRTG